MLVGRVSEAILARKMSLHDAYLGSNLMSVHSSVVSNTVIDL